MSIGNKQRNYLKARIQEKERKKLKSISEREKEKKNLKTEMKEIKMGRNKKIVKYKGKKEKKI